MILFPVIFWGGIGIGTACYVCDQMIHWCQQHGMQKMILLTTIAFLHVIVFAGLIWLIAT